MHLISKKMALHLRRDRGAMAKDNAGNFSDFSNVVYCNLEPFDKVPPQEPVAFGLEQNYPNPFNPQTTISYALASAEHVSLAVYDLLGRQVAQLVDATQEAGLHEATFDASGVASGTYVYKIRAGSYTAVRSSSS